LRGATDVDALFERMREHGDDPRVSAALYDVLRLMKEVEAALGHPITSREWLDDRWMENRGLVEAINRIFRVVHECTVRNVECTGGPATRSALARPGDGGLRGADTAGARRGKGARGGRLVSCLEGGYNLNALAEGVQTHLEELLAAAV
jgi:hypothetical protein